MVIWDDPLAGAEGNPVGVIPIMELPNYPRRLDEETGRLSIGEPYSYTCLEYDLEKEQVEVEIEASEALHEWLLSLIPQLDGIKKAKGWKLDKTELMKAKTARGKL